MVNIRLLATCIGVGVFLGLVGFTISIATVGGVFFRGDRFTIKGYIEFYRAPFLIGSPKGQAVWGLLPDGTSLPLSDKLKSLSMNWIVFAGVGAILGSIYYMVFA